MKKLDKKTKQRIISQLKSFREDPISQAKKLTNPKLGTYRYKVGDYRVVFDVNNKTVIILRVGHRKTIYK